MQSLARVAAYWARLREGAQGKGGIHQKPGCSSRSQLDESDSSKHPNRDPGKPLPKPCELKDGGKFSHVVETRSALLQYGFVLPSLMSCI